MASTRIDVGSPSGARMAAYPAHPEGTATGTGVALPREVSGINANKPDDQ